MDAAVVVGLAVPGPGNNTTAPSGASSSGTAPTRDTVDIDTQQQLQMGARHTIVFGAGFRASRGDDLGDGPGFFFDPQVRTSTLASIFAQDDISLSSRVSLVVRSRLNGTTTGLELQMSRCRWIREAKSGPYLHEGADVLRGFLPESLKVKSATAAEELIRTIDPKGAAAAEAEKAMRALQNPTATPPASPTATPGPGPATPPKPESTPGAAAAPKPDSAPGRSYPPRDQRELDRLIGTQR